MFLFLLFLFPTLVSLYIETANISFLTEKQLSSIYIFKYCFSFFITGIFPYIYLFRLINKRYILLFVSFIRYLVVFIIVFSFTLTKHTPRDSILLIVFDTNLNEIFEFIATIRLGDYLIFVLYWVVYAAFLYKTKTPPPSGTKGDFVFNSVCFLVFTAFAIVSRSENNIIHWFQEACKTYQSVKSVANDERSLDISKNIKISDISPLLKRTVVIIIGESETGDVFKEHTFQFSKLLNHEWNNLILVPKSETTAAYTIDVLKQLFLHRLSLKSEKKFNLLNLYKNGGFKTFWLSNQFKRGKMDDFLYVMAGFASYQKFYNIFNFEDLHERNRKNSHYDDVLVDGVKNALEDPAGKKIIFLHLYGSHNYVKNRYPDKFHSPLVEPKEKKDYTEKEHYRNAAAYTNTVLAKVIQILAQQRSANAVIYFSDHGSNPEKPLFRNYNEVKDVPLFFWLSEEYQKHFPDLFKNLSCLQYVYFSNLPYIFNKIIGAEIEDISASPQIKACFAKEEDK